MSATPAAASRAWPSLRARLLRHVMVPLAITWLAGTLLTLSVAQFFTGRAFDRSLLDDAYLIASNVREANGLLTLDLSPRELNSVLFDQAESILFTVQQADGTLIAGRGNLRPAPLNNGLSFQYHDLVHEGRPLRAVTLAREQPLPFRVIMAQTTASRSTLLQRALLYSTVPQILLLTGLALWLRRVIDRDTAPLAQLEQTVNRRDETDLTPVDVPARTRDVQQLGAAINSLLARLEHSLRSQREFAGNVAHELRTPLAGIRALAEYGLAQKDPQAWRQQLERIALSEARASRMVDQLLALALAEEVRAGLLLQPVALGPLVRDAVMRFLPRADAAGVDLGARGLDDDGPMEIMAPANAMLVEGILNNLLDNALRYARPLPHGGDTPAPAVTVALAWDGRAATLSVSDNGPGLAPGLREQLTQRWAQGEAGQLLGQGVGLGLAIVAQYAQLMHARLDLAPGPGGTGLVASVLFPAPDQNA